MNWHNIIDNSDGKSFKNKGSRSLYTDLEPQFKYTFGTIYIGRDNKKPFYRYSPTPTLNNRISPIPSLNTLFLRRPSNS